MSDRSASPVVVCRRVASAPAMTGRLAEGAWAAAEVFADFHRLRRSAEEALEPPRFATRLRCLWDERCLYVGFECDSPDVWATKTRRDDELWEEPVCEVFLACEPAEGAAGFFEFQVNPLGAIYDAFVADSAQSADWRRWCKWDCPGLAVAAEVEGRLNDRAHRDQGWRARFAIPFEPLAAGALARPRAGESWRVNFCRYDYARQLAEPELSSAAPTVAVFDDLERFCGLKFVT